MTTAASSFDQRQLRDVLGTFVTGVTVVTTRDEYGVAHGVTANSFSSVSLDPPLVLWSQSLNSRSYPFFRDSKRFAVNILADDQIGISNHFARSHDDKFSGIAHSDGLGRVPVLEGAAAHLECVQVAAYPSGDHVVYIGQVERIGHSSRRALAFCGGRYMVAHSCDLEASYVRPGSLRPVLLETIQLATAALPGIAERLGDHTLCLAVWGNHGPTALHWEPSRQPASDQLFTGLVMPVTRSATGQVFAAFLPEEATQPFVEDDLRQFSMLGEDLATRRQGFVDAIAEVRQRGIARAIGSTPSLLHKVAVNTFSAPIRDADGKMIMALTLASAAPRLAPDWNGEVPLALAAAARDISRQLGYIESSH